MGREVNVKFPQTVPPLDKLKRFGALTSAAIVISAAIMGGVLFAASGTASAWEIKDYVVRPDSAYPNQTVQFEVDLTNEGNTAINIVEARYEIKWNNRTDEIQLIGNKSIPKGGSVTLKGTLTTAGVVPGIYEGIIYVKGQTLTILDQATKKLAANFTINEPPPLTVAITAASIGGPAPLDVAFNSRVTGGIGPYSYAWSFGDGSTSEDPDIEHRYARSGRYNVTLEVTDSVGTRSEASVTVTVMAAQMIATILSTATNGRSPLNTALSAEVAGGVAPYSYSWSTGDGGVFTSASFSYEYHEAGTYTVRLLVTDAEGSTARDLITIVVLSQTDRTVDPVAGPPIEIGPYLLAYIFVFVGVSNTVVALMIYRNRTKFRR